MKRLNNENLINTYLEAIRCELDNEFIQLLLAEINRRDLMIDAFTQSIDTARSDK